ncbi:hypothetical protein NDS46_29985 (plasmid) [Paenibacillus thiaminolyticus]|uniref:hypothetical protein n=1 Tax=Paenibacillus thiaminolyticus TaxID=49283 RepID=UPI00232B33C7|nr:hypothetical protein [Paenibacillus thiaminolyticus]WCF11579.1 hypothetical protein NDS46_29985 [Paenibacillus thiaminolyticus]
MKGEKFTLIDFKDIEILIEKCIITGFELPRSGFFSNTNDVINLVRRKKRLEELYKLIFGNESFDNYIQGQLESTYNFGGYHVDGVQVKFTNKQKGFRFNKCKNYMICTTETETELYELIVPFNENTELYLYGIFALAEGSRLLDWSEYGFISKNKLTNRITKVHMNFSYSLQKGKNNKDKDISAQDYFVLGGMQEVVLEVFSNINNDRIKKLALSQVELELLRIWSIMHVNCDSRNNIHFQKPKRPISVAWQDYTSFKEWALNKGFKLGLMLTRLDYQGDYKEANCRWEEKASFFPDRYFWHYYNNMYYPKEDPSIPITINGETKKILEWAEIYNLSVHVIIGRMYSGLNGEELVAPTGTRPVTYWNRPITIEGVTKSAKEWAKQYGISPNTIASRMRYGWTGKDLIAPPQGKKQRG